MRRGRGRAEPLEGPPPPLSPGRSSPLPWLPRHTPSHPSPPPPRPRPQSPTPVCSPAASHPAHRSSLLSPPPPSLPTLFSSSAAAGPSVSRASHWAPPDGPSPRAVPSSRWPALLQFTGCLCRPLWPRIRPEIPGSIGATPPVPMPLWAPAPAGTSQPPPALRRSLLLGVS